MSQHQKEQLHVSSFMSGQVLRLRLLDKDLPPKMFLNQLMMSLKPGSLKSRVRQRKTRITCQPKVSSLNHSSSETWITTPGSLRDLVRQGDQMRCFFARWILMVQKFKNRAGYHAYDKFVILIILSCPFPRFHEFQGASFALIESKVGHARLNFGMSTQLATGTHMLFPCPNRISSEPETTMTENDALLATLI